MKNPLGDRRVFESFQIFCTETSIHGFKEAFLCRKNLWKLIWWILIISALGMTSFQLRKAVYEYVDSSSHLRVTQAKEIKSAPPLKLCFLHWMYWLDWEKALALNFTKESVLYGMSFLTNIYTEEFFDFDRAKRTFSETMDQNNFTLLKQFYRAVAKTFQHSYNDDEEEFYRIPISYRSQFFKEFNVDVSIYWGPMFCYITPGEVILRTLREFEMYEIFLYVHETFVWSRDGNVNDAEYDAYIFDWFRTNTYYREIKADKPKNLSDFVLPILFYADGYSDDYTPVLEQDAFYLIKMQISVHQWKNYPDSPCLDDKIGIASNFTSIVHCTTIYQKKRCQCKTLTEGIITNTDTANNTPQNQIFLSTANNASAIQTQNLCDFSKANENSCKNNLTSKAIRDLCTPKVTPCEVWIYTYSVKMESYGAKVAKYLKKTTTVIQVTYPYEYNVMIMAELDRQTFEEFIGNVGGLLGVWTGASLMSIIQAVYLCFCSSRKDEANCGKGNRKNDKTGDDFAIDKF